MGLIPPKEERGTITPGGFPDSMLFFFPSLSLPGSPKKSEVTLKQNKRDVNP
jgi:hypothetical protein